MERLFWCLIGLAIGFTTSHFNTPKQSTPPLRGFYLHAYFKGKPEIVWDIELPYGDIPGNWHEVDFMEITRTWELSPEKKP